MIKLGNPLKLNLALNSRYVPGWDTTSDYDGSLLLWGGSWLCPTDDFGVELKICSSLSGFISDPIFLYAAIK